ncbi:MAG: hypothetical protein K2X07_04985 [Caulobacteraceae bacterium]|nr:hypothetical protein [Caulobacteraceae bacterium]
MTWLADVVLAALVLEAAFLTLFRKRGIWDVILILGPGAVLVVALRLALAGADWWWIGAALFASLPLHLLDLARRPA